MRDHSDDYGTGRGLQPIDARRYALIRDSLLEYGHVLDAGLAEELALEAVRAGGDVGFCRWIDPREVAESGGWPRIRLAGRLAPALVVTYQPEHVDLTDEDAVAVGAHPGLKGASRRDREIVRLRNANADLAFEVSRLQGLVRSLGGDPTRAF